MAYLPIKAELPTMLVSTLSQQLLIRQALRGEPVEPLLFAVSTVVTVLLGAVLVAVTIALYDREQVIFGR